jgi:hypothetical protein
MTTTGRQADLLRISATARAMAIENTLHSRGQPMVLPIVNYQVRGLGLPDLDAADRRELTALLGFLNLWISVLPITDGLLWDGGGGWCGTDE